MAGDWIKIEHGLPTKPEVMALADLLGVRDDEAVGLLVRFWCWVDSNLSPECPLVPGTFVRLDRIVGRDGFATALQSVGWLSVENGEVAIPNYDHHLSQSAKRRAVEAKKKRTQRKKMSRCCPDAKGTKTGPEKRREENIKPPKSPKGDSGFDAMEAALPFDSPAFLQAWGEWVTYRKQIRKKLAPLSVSKQLKFLAALGECRAIETIEHAITKGWTGLFEPPAQRQATPDPPEPTLPFFN